MLKSIYTIKSIKNQIKQLNPLFFLISSIFGSLGAWAEIALAFDFFVWASRWLVADAAHAAESVNVIEGIGLVLLL